MGIQTESVLCQAYNLIENGEIYKAKGLLEEALTSDLDNNDLIFAVHCCSFWVEPYSELNRLDNFDQGESLVNQWKRFSRLLERETNPSESTVYIFRKSVFSRALEAYKTELNNFTAGSKAEIFRKIGLCYKKLGSYEQALNCLSEANRIENGSAPIIAEMADCFALCGEDKQAKVLFREAFFIEAKKIELCYLDSPLINLLIKEVEGKGYSGDALKEWIPVYGALLKVFNVKRELRPLESGKIRSEMYARENELKDPKNDSSVITPRLLNLYFWLIDHYMMSKESVVKINQVLLRIKLLDPAVYELYVK